jgi:hypothetical protein
MYRGAGQVTTLALSAPQPHAGKPYLIPMPGEPVL